MKKICQFIISFILMSSLMLSGILCSAALYSEELSGEQLMYIVEGASYTGQTGSWGFRTWTNETGSYYGYGNYYSNKNPLSSLNFTVNYPIFLSGFDSLVVELGIFREVASSMAITNIQAVYGSVATTLPFSQISSLGTGVIAVPGSTQTAAYRGLQYQVTISQPIDYLRVSINFASRPVNDLVMVGLRGIQVKASSQAMLNIQNQVTQIGNKLDELKTSVESASSNIGGIAVNQGKILDSVDDIVTLAQTLVSNQEIIMYSSDDDQIILTALDTRTLTVKDALTEYKTIINQYHNPPDINNVTNIIDSGLPNDFNPGELLSPLNSVLNSNIVITILIAVATLILISYVLFGKKA